MGRTYTPTHVVEFEIVHPSHKRLTAAAWEGRATAPRLLAFLRGLNASFAPGGANEHSGIEHVERARLVRQSNGRTAVIAILRRDEGGSMRHDEGGGK